MATNGVNIVPNSLTFTPPTIVKKPVVLPQTTVIPQKKPITEQQKPILPAQPKLDSFSSTQIKENNSNKNLFAMGTAALGAVILCGIGLLAFKGRGVEKANLIEEVQVLSAEATELKNEMLKIYDDAVKFLNLEHKPEINFVSEIGREKNTAAEYVHASRKINLNVEFPHDLHYVIVKPINSSAIDDKVEIVMCDKINANKIINDKARYMKKYEIDSNLFELEVHKLNEEEIKAYTTQSLLHELRHAKQSELIHKTHNLNEIIGLEHAYSQRLGENRTIAQLEQEFSTWKHVSVDNNLSIKDKKLADKFFNDYSKNSKDKVTYYKDELELDAHQFEASEKCIDFIFKKFNNLSDTFKKILKVNTDEFIIKYNEA
ncbi:MAG: hypothetical protein WCK67_09535 [bacterium]